MSKYIDLAGRIESEIGGYVAEHKVTLAYLDRHPDQVPGRTITEGDLIAAVDETNHEDMNEYQKARALLVHLGHTIPDPEPTNAEKLTIYLGLHDLDAITNDGVTEFARQLDADGVKAPGESDE